MITAIDTNILLDVLVDNNEFCDGSIAALERAANAGSLVICDIVYAELCVHFNAQGDCDRFLHENEIRVEHLTKESMFFASRVWATYRRQGGTRTRILGDFLIGAHAQIQATALLSRDRGFYRKLFRALTVVDPAGA